MYCTAYSSAPCAAPMHIAALPQRSWLMCEISVLNDSLFVGVAPQEHVVGLDAHVVERELGLARRRAAPSSRACR